MRSLFGILMAALLTAGLSAPAQAQLFTISGNQVGNDVIFTMTGSFDTSTLGPGQSLYADGSIGGRPSNATLFYGPTGLTFNGFSGFTGPGSWGPGGGFILADSGSGDPFGISGFAGEISLAPGYVSGTMLSSTLTYTNRTLASMGYTPGLYTYTATGNLIEVNIGGVPEPRVWAMMLGGFALAGGTLRRRRKALAAA